MIKVQNEVTVYEIDGTRTTIERPRVKLLSHWNDHDLVVMEMLDGKKYTFSAKDLMAAISNAQNTNRFYA